MGQGSKRFFRIGLPPVIASFPIGCSPSLEVLVNSFSWNSQSSPRLHGDLHGIRPDRHLHSSFDVTKRKAVRDKVPQRIVTHVASHLPHAGSVARWFFAAHSNNSHALRTRMAEGAYRHFTKIGKVASLNQQPSQPEHLEPFRHHFWHARRLNHHVGAATV